MELYRKVYIKSEADLPPVRDKAYITHELLIGVDYLYRLTDNAKHWLNHIDWYLQPIEITDADIEAYFKTWQNPRIKTADEKYEKWLNKYLDELIDSAIRGAKAMRDGKIKHK